MPKIRNITAISGNNLIEVTVQTDSSDIETYYYSIDGINYETSTDNHYTFTGITTSADQTIRVYAQDSKGRLTAIKEITARRTIPVPTIVITGQKEIVNGEEWYAPGATVTITYANNMANLVGKYKTTNMHTNVVNGWLDVTETTTIINDIRETIRIDAYNIEEGKNDGELKTQTINIMADPEELQQSYYEYGSGNTYPVLVTGRLLNSGEKAYGISPYSGEQGEYNTAINVAAVHSGLVGVGETKVIFVTIVPCPEGGYRSSTRNEITTTKAEITSKGYTLSN